MQEMDCIEVTVEKEKYARHGVHKGMQGWICDPRCINEAWLVNFPQCGEKDEIITDPFDFVFCHGRFPVRWWISGSWIRERACDSPNPGFRLAPGGSESGLVIQVDPGGSESGLMIRYFA